MPTIDQEGLEEVKKVRDALQHMYGHLEKNNLAKDVLPEYSFIFKILGQMEAEWNHEVNRVYTVPDELTINGKRYTS
jgi:hypothetical protein